MHTFRPDPQLSYPGSMMGGVSLFPPVFLNLASI